MIDGWVFGLIIECSFRQDSKPGIEFERGKLRRIRLLSRTGTDVAFDRTTVQDRLTAIVQVAVEGHSTQ